MREGGATRHTTDPWLASAGLLLSLGLGVELRAGYFYWSFGLLLGIAVFAWVLATALDLRPPAVDLLLRAGLPGGCATVLALDGLGRVTPWAVLVVAGLVALSPVCRALTLRGFRWLVAGDAPVAVSSRPSAAALEASRRRHPSVRPELPWPETVAPPALSRAWSDSYFALRATASEEEHRHIVELRGRYLDKMEESDPDGFAAWLRAGADPARAFQPDPAGPDVT